MQKIHRNIQYTYEHHTRVITELTTINLVNIFLKIDFFLLSLTNKIKSF